MIRAPKITMSELVSAIDEATRQVALKRQRKALLKRLGSKTPPPYLTTNGDTKFKPGQSGNPATQFKPGNPHRWKPGVSGNPAGMAKARVRLAELVKEATARAVEEILRNASI